MSITDSVVTTLLVLYLCVGAALVVLAAIMPFLAFDPGSAAGFSERLGYFLASFVFFTVSVWMLSNVPSLPWPWIGDLS